MFKPRVLPLTVALSFVLLTGVADATSTTCATTVVCAEYINSSSGVAIHGEANTGIGIRGTSNGSTGFYGASRSGSALFPGVEGESLNQTGEDAAGAFGLTAESGGTPPAYGVIAYGSIFGVGAAAAGPGNGTKQMPTSIAVFGQDSSSSGPDTNVGVYGSSANGTAVLGLANANTTIPNSDSYFANYPIGVYADAEPKGTGAAYAVEAVSGYVPIDIYNSKSQEDVQIARQSSLIATTTPFGVDNSGDVTAADVSATQLTTNKEPYVRTTGSSGTTRMSYSARTTTPVMEDFGEGQLAGGRGYVKLDPALSDVIDNRNAYQVFLTPEGDSNGLYVTQKTPSGFVVREQHGGRSTIAFSYRILAKPVDDDSKRLALAPPLPKNDAIMERRRRDAHPGVAQMPLDPIARLQAHLGPAAFARELKAARAIERGP